MNSILLIDDKPEVLDELKTALQHHLGANEAEIRLWAPGHGQDVPFETFSAKIDDDTVLVVTDYDLTGQGQTGLFGASVVAWSQARAVPVGDYSRALNSALPSEPNLFELRVPKETQKAAVYIAAVFRGFAWIKKELATNPELLEKRSPPAVIASLLGEPPLENHFALYGVRLGATSAALVERFVNTSPADVEPTVDEKQSLLCYIVGHLLLNAILRFPGPIVSAEELTAYLGIAKSEAHTLHEIFGSAVYSGPFGSLETYYWQYKVDEILRPMLDALGESTQAPETYGELNRLALEAHANRDFTRHSCPRCQGVNGGFWCPFTHRAVCQLANCSVGANSWVPQGARLCRIERDFYEEWAPILGI